MLSPSTLLSALHGAPDPRPLEARAISLPTDPASIFVLLLFVVSVVLVLWFGGRPRGKGGKPA